MEKRTFLATISALFSSFLVASCCLGPAIFILTGVSIGWLGSFTRLSAYKPYFIGTALLVLSYPFYQLYLKKPAIECDCEIDPAKIKMKKINKALFWVTFSILIVASIYPYVFNLVLD